MSLTRTSSSKLRLAIFILVSAVLLLIAHLLDPWAFKRLGGYAGAMEADWGRLLRVMGFLPTWYLAAAALALIHRPRLVEIIARPPHPYPILLALAPTLGGLCAEVLKILIRRERPNLHAGEYFFRPWGEKFLSGSGLGMPSSHALVAFAAVFMLCRMYPRAWPVWLILGLGCAFTRVIAQAHFLSDVTLAGIVGYAVAWALWTIHLRLKPEASCQGPVGV